MDTLDTATHAANWFDNFIKHGSIISVLLSLLFAWGLAIFASIPIHWNVKDDERATFYARCVCILGSFLITAGTWPNEFRWAWACTMAVISPILGLVVLWQLKKRAPDLYDWLSMKKTTRPPSPPYGP